MVMVFGLGYTAASILSGFGFVCFLFCAVGGGRLYYDKIVAYQRALPATRQDRFRSRADSHQPVRVGLTVKSFAELLVALPGEGGTVRVEDPLHRIRGIFGLSIKSENSRNDIKYLLKSCSLGNLLSY